MSRDPESTSDSEKVDPEGGGQVVGGGVGGGKGGRVYTPWRLCLDWRWTALLRKGLMLCGISRG